MDRYQHQQQAVHFRQPTQNANYNNNNNNNLTMRQPLFPLHQSQVSAQAQHANMMHPLRQISQSFNNQNQPQHPRQQQQQQHNQQQHHHPHHHQYQQPQPVRRETQMPTHTSRVNSGQSHYINQESVSSFYEPTKPSRQSLSQQQIPTQQQQQRPLQQQQQQSSRDFIRNQTTSTTYYDENENYQNHTAATIPSTKSVVILDDDEDVIMTSVNNSKMPSSKSSNTLAPTASALTNSNSNSNSFRSLLTTSSSSELQKQLFMPKYTSSSSLTTAGQTSSAAAFNFLLNSTSASSKTSQEILNELELKQFRLQREQEKARPHKESGSYSSSSSSHHDGIRLTTITTNRNPFDSTSGNRSKAAAAPSGFDVISSDSSDSDDSGNDEPIKKRRLNDNSEMRSQLKQSLKGVKQYYEQLSEKARKEKYRTKEEEKAARVRQELIESAQAAQEKERIEAERRTQREKLVQIKRAEELRKQQQQQKKKAANMPIMTLEYRNRMKEELRNMNLDEQLLNPQAPSSNSSSSITGAVSIAPLQKRSNVNMDFEYLAEEADETIDNANYFALLRFVFSQDFNQTDSLRIENKRIPNKFSNWKEYFSIFEYLFLMECVANIHQAFNAFPSNENFRQPLGCYLKPVSAQLSKENTHGFLELQVCRRGADLDESEFTSSMEDDYYTLASMRNHAVLISSSSELQLSALSNKVVAPGAPFLFFGWVVPPDKSDPKSVLKLYVDIEQSAFSAIFDENPLQQVSVFNFSKMTTFIREYLAIKNMRENELSRFIYNPSHIVETNTAISNPQILVPLFDELSSKYNQSQFQSIKEICLTNQGICMLQGPPGTGKTHTLLGLLSGLYYYIKKNPEITKPKIMICAPSNTAVDEIVSRIVEYGLQQPGGKTIRINVVRVGSIDYVPQENVKRASLEYQIERLMHEKGIQQTGVSKEFDKETLIDMRINVARVNQEIEKAKKELVGTELRDLLNNLYTKKRTLKAKIAVQKLEKVARRDQIKSISDQILGLADVVCCTLSSSMSEKLERFKNQIEVLIVDEAAQCSEPNNIIPLFYQPNKMVLIGDPKQLPATTFQPDSNVTKYNRSLFERIIDNSIKPYFLDEQYRMHPDIRAFPSSAFYDNKLRDGQLVQTREFPKFVSKMEKHNVQFIDIAFSRERFANKSYENDAEAEAAIHICTAVFKQLNDALESPSIGIITPYKQQTKLINDMIRRLIEKQFWKYIQVNTVDSFQGQEKDIIIFTTVRATKSKDHFRERMIGFLQDERRMNVALTRARYCLFVVGHADTLNSNQTWGNYVDSMAAIKRYGKLERRENLREIGEMIINGTLIAPDRASSVYVKKDWGEEYRQAQLEKEKEKEQINELKLTDFETITAAILPPSVDAAADEDTAPTAIDGTSTTDSSLIPSSSSNNNSGEKQKDKESPPHLQLSAHSEDGQKDSSSNMDIEDNNNNNTNNTYDPQNGGDATPPRRSGVSMQEAMEREQEEKEMREFGSGIKGLKSLLNIGRKNNHTKRGATTHRHNHNNSSLLSQQQQQLDFSSDYSHRGNNDSSMEEEISINLDAAEGHALAGLTSSVASVAVIATNCTSGNVSSSVSSVIAADTPVSNNNATMNKNSNNNNNSASNNQPTKVQQLLMKSIFVPEKDRINEFEEKNLTMTFDGNGNCQLVKNTADIYDQMRKQKEMSLKAKKVTSITSSSSSSSSSSSNTYTHNSNNQNSSKTSSHAVVESSSTATTSTHSVMISTPTYAAHPQDKHHQLYKVPQPTSLSSLQSTLQNAQTQQITKPFSAGNSAFSRPALSSSSATSSFSAFDSINKLRQNSSSSSSSNVSQQSSTNIQLQHHSHPMSYIVKPAQPIQLKPYSLGAKKETTTTTSFNSTSNNNNSNNNNNNGKNTQVIIAKSSSSALLNSLFMKKI